MAAPAPASHRKGFTITETGDKVTLRAADFDSLLAQLHAKADAEADRPIDAEAIIAALGKVRVTLERLAPTLDYYTASAIGSYLRPLEEIVHERATALYPRRDEDEAT